MENTTKQLDDVKAKIFDWIEERTRQELHYASVKFSKRKAIFELLETCLDLKLKICFVRDPIR